MHAFLTFWCGGCACFILIILSEIKAHPEVLESNEMSDVRVVLSVRPELGIIFLLYVIMWPFSIAWNTIRVMRGKAEQREFEKIEATRVELPAEFFEEPPGFKPLDDPTTCELCRHEKGKHGDAGCEGCFCHIFVRFGPPETCICREWGTRSHVGHHPKCPSSDEWKLNVGDFDDG